MRPPRPKGGRPAGRWWRKLVRVRPLDEVEWLAFAEAARCDPALLAAVSLPDEISVRDTLDRVLTEFASARIALTLLPTEREVATFLRRIAEHARDQIRRLEELIPKLFLGIAELGVIEPVSSPEREAIRRVAKLATAADRGLHRLVKVQTTHYRALAEQADKKADAAFATVVVGRPGKYETQEPEFWLVIALVTVLRAAGVDTTLGADDAADEVLTTRPLRARPLFF